MTDAEREQAPKESAEIRHRLVERCRIAYGRSSHQRRLRVFDASHGRCVYCGNPLTFDWNVDHVIPRSKGGANTAGNLAAACGSCNAFKLDRTPAEWFSRIQVFC